MEVLHPYSCFTHTHIRQCWSYKEARHGESPLKNWVHNGETPGIAFWFTGVRQQESPDCSWKVYINTYVPCILSKFYTYSVQMLHTHTPHTHTTTHTHPAGAGSTLARQEEKKSGHKRRANGQNNAGGEGNKRTSGTNLHGERT